MALRPQRARLGLLGLLFITVSCGGNATKDSVNLGDECRSFSGDPTCGNGAIWNCRPFILPHSDGAVHCGLACGGMTIPSPYPQCPSGYTCRSFGQTENMDVLAACMDDQVASSPTDSELCSAFDGDPDCGGGAIPMCASFEQVESDSAACLIQCYGPGVKRAGDCGKGYVCSLFESDGVEVGACVEDES